MRARKQLRRAGLAACALSLVAAVPAGATVEIHAHRGGTLENGVPVTPENSMPAFRNARKLGVDFVELDAKITKDGVAVIMHDATLDRTTNCSGPVKSFTLAQLGSCRIDILGTTGNFVQVARSSVRIPTATEVLAWARRHGVRLHLEIKNQPTDSDFDPTPAFAQIVLGAIQASGIPKPQVLIQSFWPPNLDAAEAAGLRTTLLTSRELSGAPFPTNEGGVEFAALRGYDVVSPDWPPSDPTSYVALAHSLGKLVVPYTLNTATGISDAVGAGVDGVISDDPVLAQQVVSQP